MPHDDPTYDVDLVLPAVPESVARARVAMAELAHRAGLADAAIEDVRLAVTEAAANAVRHAYEPPTRGELQVLGRVRPDGIEVTVVDNGRGVAAASRLGTPDGLGLGMGLPLMRSLADDVRVESTPGGGCTVTLRFPRRR